MKSICVFALTLGLTVPLCAADEDSPNVSQFLGTFKIVGGQRDGKAIPKAEFESSVVIITKDRIVGTDKNRKEFFGCTYALDTTSKPWTIRMTSTTPKVGEKSVGVVSVDGDVVKICYNLPGGKPPASFKAGEKQHCFELQRITR